MNGALNTVYDVYTTISHYAPQQNVPCIGTEQAGGAGSRNQTLQTHSSWLFIATLILNETNKYIIL